MLSHSWNSKREFAESDTVTKIHNDAELLYARSYGSHLVIISSQVVQEIKKDGRSQHNIKGKGTTRQRATNKKAMEQKSTTRCYNCGEAGHIATKGTKSKREKGVCYTCGKMGH